MSINLKRYMTEVEESLGAWLSAVLDDDKVCQEMKIDIIKWFATFEYRSISDFSTLDLILDKAEKMNW